MQLNRQTASTIFVLACFLGISSYGSGHGRFIALGAAIMTFIGLVAGLLGKEK